MHTHAHTSTYTGIHACIQRDFIFHLFSTVCVVLFVVSTSSPWTLSTCIGTFKRFVYGQFVHNQRPLLRLTQGHALQLCGDWNIDITLVSIHQSTPKRTSQKSILQLIWREDRSRWLTATSHRETGCQVNEKGVWPWLLQGGRNLQQPIGPVWKTCGMWEEATERHKQKTYAPQWQLMWMVFGILGLELEF